MRRFIPRQSPCISQYLTILFLRLSVIPVLKVAKGTLVIVLLLAIGVVLMLTYRFCFVLSKIVERPNEHRLKRNDGKKENDYWHDVVQF